MSMIADCCTNAVGVTNFYEYESASETLSQNNPLIPCQIFDVSRGVVSYWRDTHSTGATKFSMIDLRFFGKDMTPLY